MEIAGYKISMLLADHFRLDGGAMFGVVPKPLWEKRLAADEKNRIPLASRLLLLESSERTVLIDVGCGDKWDEKQRGIYAFENKCLLHQAPWRDRVSDIILTHLHFDHAGGISYTSETEELELSFPRARVYLQQSNYDIARQPGPRERGSYLPQNVSVLEKADLRLLNGPTECLGGITVNPIDGHTKGMQWVLIGSGENALAYPADLIPTAHHLPVPWVMGYDLCAETSMREKQEFLSAAAREGWWIVFEHDVETSCVRVEAEGEGFRISERTSLPLFKAE